MRHLMTGLSLSLLASGCITPGPQAPLTRYAVEPRLEVAQAQATEQSLGIRPLETLRPYDTQKIVYREHDLEIGNYENVEWAELPRDTVTRALLDALVATGRYRDVGNAADMRPDHILTGQLRRFDEVRTEDPWVAVCEVRIEVRETLEKKPVWSATLSVKEPLDENTPAALAAAMSRAVAQIAQTAATQIAGQ